MKLMLKKMQLINAKLMPERKSPVEVCINKLNIKYLEQIYLYCYKNKKMKTAGVLFPIYGALFPTFFK